MPGGVYLVAARGNHDENIVRDDEDRIDFFRVVARVVDRYSLVVHAYCLLDDRYHLLIETPLANLAAAMRHLNGHFAHRVNQRYGRRGHVFGDRYAAVVLECGPDILEAARSIHRAPLRAGLARRPESYPWSSFAATVGDVPEPPYLRTTAILAELDDRTHAARRRYRRLVTAQRTSWP
jgi:putative transposase